MREFSCLFRFLDSQLSDCVEYLLFPSLFKLFFQCFCLLEPFSCLRPPPLCLRCSSHLGFILLQKRIEIVLLFNLTPNVVESIKAGFFVCLHLFAFLEFCCRRLIIPLGNFSIVPQLPDFFEGIISLEYFSNIFLPFVCQSALIAVFRGVCGKIPVSVIRCYQRIQLRFHLIHIDAPGFHYSFGYGSGQFGNSIA